MLRFLFIKFAVIAFPIFQLGILGRCKQPQQFTIFFYYYHNDIL